MLQWFTVLSFLSIYVVLTWSQNNLWEKFNVYIFILLLMIWWEVHKTVKLNKLTLPRYNKIKMVYDVVIINLNVVEKKIWNSIWTFYRCQKTIIKNVYTTVRYDLFNFIILYSVKNTYISSIMCCFITCNVKTNSLVELGQ